MNAYLLNLTTIWLAGLLCYNLFLKKETYHGLNRTYLLLSLLLGLLIPLIHTPAQNHLQHIPFQQPLYHFAAAKQDMMQKTLTPVVSPVSVSHQSFNWLLTVKDLYISGCLVMFLFMLKELFTIAGHYRNGQKQREGKWTIIETGKQHGPFSLLHYIFVNSRAQYNDAQWKIIVQHEQAHGKLLHFADLLFLQILQVFLWFHPLVYIYRKKLLLVHEYQADERSATERNYYGHFLIEQSLLQSAPALTHSFNRLPIKQRITMLTRSSSSRIHLLKLGIILPLITVSFICCTRSKQEVSVKKHTASTDTSIQLTHGILTYTLSTVHTIHWPGPIKDSENVITVQETNNLRYNNVPVLDSKTAKEPPRFTGNAQTLGMYAFDHIKNELNSLKDGVYVAEFNNTIVDQNGTVVYYGDYSVAPFRGITPKDIYNFPGNITDTSLNKGPGKEQEEAFKRIVLDLVLDKTLFKPATKDRQPVPYSISIGNKEQRVVFNVKDHVITIVDAGTSSNI